MSMATTKLTKKFQKQNFKRKIKPVTIVSDEEKKEFN